MNTTPPWVSEQLDNLRQAGLLRELPAPQSGDSGAAVRLNFASNDYLGLRRNPAVLQSARTFLERYGSGAAASRLLAGNLPCHHELESTIARLTAYPAALLFGSGYLANCGVIPSLVGRNDVVFADRLVHASLLDGIRLSRARLVRFHHNDPEHLDTLLRRHPARRRLVVTESVFSMDGDLAPLPELVETARRHDAMIFVDEAHAVGVFGPRGGGRVREAALSDRVNLTLATLGKALASYGGCVTCSSEMKQFLVNRARTFIFSTGLPPAVAGAAVGVIQWLESHPECGRRLLENASHFRGLLKAAGLDTGTSASQIVPVIVGDPRKAVELARRLRKRGILVGAIRPPSVPPGTSRLRFSITLALNIRELEEVAAAVVSEAQHLGIP